MKLKIWSKSGPNVLNEDPLGSERVFFWSIPNYFNIITYNSKQVEPIYIYNIHNIQVEI